MAADRHRIFLVVDLSVAEDRVERMLSRDPEAIRIAQTRPHEYDAHRVSAAQVYGIAERDVTSMQRYVGKTTAYAAQRGTGADTLQGVFLKAGYTLTIEECKTFLQAYHARNPWIEQAYFPDIRKQLLRYRALASTRGAIMYFDFERLDEETYRRAYSWPPQREVADIINEQGFEPLADALEAKRWDAAINLQVHDELVISCWPQDAWPIAKLLRDNIEQPIFLDRKPLVIPCTYKLGDSWQCAVEWKQLPHEDDMREAARIAEEAVAKRLREAA